jgi:hypothetical protein
MKNTADVTGGKPIAVLLQSISGVSAINPLFAFYDILRGKREVLFFYVVPDTIRDVLFPIGCAYIANIKCPWSVRCDRGSKATLVGPNRMDGQKFIISSSSVLRKAR